MIAFNASGYALPFTGVESFGLLSGTSTEFVSGGDGELDYSVFWNDSILATGATMTINASRLVANESLYFGGSQETGGPFGSSAARERTR